MRKIILVIFGIYLFWGMSLNALNKGVVKNYNQKHRSDHGFDKSLPRILRVLTAKKFGGIETQTLNAYKYFLDKGYNINLLVTDKSGIKDQLLASEIHFSCLNEKKYLMTALENMRLKGRVDIIHCHKRNEYSIVRDFCLASGISCIAHYHSHAVPDCNIFRGFDAFVASSPKIFNFMRNANKEFNLGIKYVEFIHPPHDAVRFLNFEPRETKEDFFYNNFNIRIGSRPIICMIANFFRYKNHELLFKAIANLTHKNKILVDVVLAGESGDISKRSLTDIASNLKVSQYINFLGFTKLTPELLYYSDIKVLCSKNEAFGIVLMEAALMKKPIILSRGADLANILIQHEKTGLLCDSNEPSDLAAQIKRLIQDPGFAKKLGENAYNLVISEFSNQSALDKFERLYKNIYRERNI